jgi:spore maturation protein CgeB
LHSVSRTIDQSMNIVILGLAITSSWGNGHATTYRSLVKGLHRRGHRVLFLERDQPWYASNRDAPELPYCETHLYVDLKDLRSRFEARIRNADAVIVGSYVQDGADAIDWVLERARGVRAFYDIDTPVTLACLSADRCEYLRARQVAEFDLMLSFASGTTLERLEVEYGARCALPLYCSVDPDEYRPRDVRKDVDLGYMGTYSADRQRCLQSLLSESARRLPEQRFMVVGAQYPRECPWPSNVRRVEHLPPRQHAHFYCRQRCTLNLTRANMKEAGHSPSVRLFEAAACGTPIVSDAWSGIEEVLEPGEDVLIAHAPDDVVRYLRDLSDDELQRMACSARERVLSDHCSARRAIELESYVFAARDRMEKKRLAASG